MPINTYTPRAGQTLHVITMTNVPRIKALHAAMPKDITSLLNSSQLMDHLKNGEDGWHYSVFNTTATLCYHQVNRTVQQ